MQAYEVNFAFKMFTHGLQTKASAIKEETFVTR